MSRLIKSGDITKEFLEKAIQFYGTFSGTKIITEDINYQILMDLQKRKFWKYIEQRLPSLEKYFIIRQ